MNHHLRPVDRRQLERIFKGHSAVNIETFHDHHDFSACPRLPVHDTDRRTLEQWRQCAWGGSPSLRAALSTADVVLLAAYRRIWERTPFGVINRINQMGEKVPDWFISKTELHIIAHHLYGYPEPPLREQTFLVADGPHF